MVNRDKQADRIEESPDQKNDIVKFDAYLSNIGHSPEETAQILVQDLKFGFRAIEKAVEWGESILPFLQVLLNRPDEIDNHNANRIGHVLAQIKTKNSDKLAHEFFHSKNLYFQLIGTMGIVGHENHIFSEVTLNLPIRILSIGRLAICHLSDYQEGCYEDGTYLDMALESIFYCKNSKVLKYLAHLPERTPEIFQPFQFEKACQFVESFGAKEAIPILQNWLLNFRFLAPCQALSSLMKLGDLAAFDIAFRRCSNFTWALNHLQYLCNLEKTVPNYWNNDVEEMKSKVQRKTTLLCILRSYKELFNFFHENTKCLVPEEFKSWLE